MEEVYEVFVTYVNICVESPSLKEYLGWSRKDTEDDDVYDNLLYLYKRLKEKTPQIREKNADKLVADPSTLLKRTPLN